MKKIFLALSVCILFFSCQKTIESAVDDILVQAMTSGKWKMSLFTKNGVDFTSDFTSYQFQFYNNKTVDAIKNSVLEKTGTWNANSTNKTIEANFNNQAIPVSMINGLWTITKNSFLFVEATQTNGTEIKTLRLDKI